MREILFRGKRVDNGEWIKSDSICRYGGKIQLWQEKEGWVFIIPETLGQYTGETDQYNNRIFEGDILRGLFDFNAKIMINALSVFCNGSFGVRDRRCGCDRFTPFAGFCNLKWEVIGNIHDNPELWEGEE